MPITFANTEAEANYQKARAYEATGEREKAEECYLLAAEAEPTHPELWCRVGLVYRVELSYFSKACRCVATTAEEYFWRGKAAMHVDGSQNEPLDDLAVSVAMDPTQAEAWYYYAEAIEQPDGYWFDGWQPDGKGNRRPPLPEPDWDLQLECYNRAVALEPGNWKYLTARAWCHKRGGDFATTLADYTAFLGKSPTEDAQTLYHRGKLYHQHDRLEEAQADYTASLALEHTENAAEARGVLKLLAHNFKGALRDFRLTPRTWYNWRGVRIGITDPSLDRPAPAERWETAVVVLEKSGILETEHPDYLQMRCEHYLGLDHPHFERDDSRTPTEAMDRKIMPEVAQLALDDAEMLVKLKPEIPYYRELRIACLLAVPEPNFAALAADYGHVLQHTIWASKPTKQRRVAKSPTPRASHMRVEYLHRYAWAQFNTGNHAGALASFAEAVADPSNGEKVGGICLPPSPAEAYILWQLRQQLPQNPTGRSIRLRDRAWMEMAIRRLPRELEQPLRLTFEKYWFVYIQAGFYFAYPRTAEDYSVALAACATAAEQVPAIADIFRLMSLNILKGQLRQAMNQEDATEASTEAALAHYDTARAEMLAKWQG